MPLTPSTSTFPTQLRGISVDFSVIHQGIEEKDLGALTAEGLIELLERFLAIDPMELGDSDPEIIVTGRRGRYSIKNSHHKLTLRPVAEPIAAFIELSAEEIPSWMDQVEYSLQPENSATENDLDRLLINQKPSRQYYIAALMILSLCTFGATAYFSFRPTPINNEADYQPIQNSGKITSLNKETTGQYANIDGSVKILIKDPNRLVLMVADGPKHSLKEESTHAYQFMTNRNGEPVLYSPEIGVITIASKTTLNYNGDSYRRTN